MLRYDSKYSILDNRTSLPASGEYDAALALTAQEPYNRGTGRYGETIVLKVSGSWKNGSPLDIPRSQLPALPDDVDAIFAAANAILENHRPASTYE